MIFGLLDDYDPQQHQSQHQSEQHHSDDGSEIEPVVLESS